LHKMSEQFIKKVEDFTCEKCGFQVKGGGFTNHCPECLWSKHVDIHPGDRAATCSGLMEPVAIETKNREERVTHQCIRCGYSKKNKIEKEDSYERVIEVSKKLQE